MNLQKLLNLFNWQDKAEPPSSEDKLISKLPQNLKLPHKDIDKDIDDTEEATRPLYRIGKRKPSEFQKAIDLSG
jgi:hypothetical protein